MGGDIPVREVIWSSTACGPRGGLRQVMLLSCRHVLWRTIRAEPKAPPRPRGCEMCWFDRQERPLSACEILRADQPTSLLDILEQLAAAAEHLLTDHDCDRIGHEGVREAQRAALELAADLRYGRNPSDPGHLEGETTRR